LATTTSRLPLGRAHLLASATIREARRAGLPLDSLSSVGSLRRYAPDVGDVTLLASAAAAVHEEVITRFAQLPSVTGVTVQTPSSVTALTPRGAVTLHLSTPEHAGAALAWHTGSRAHTDQLRARASRMQLRFTDGTLTRATGPALPTSSETELYRYLQLPFIAPELREGADEIAIAEAGGLPELVADLHIRGDLHMHTTWSDGRDTLELMVWGAMQLGYEYVAITDHSERAWSSRKLTRDDVPKQREEIDALRERVKGIEILHGIEVDIMKDGSLDFDDALLESFDIVLASLHDHGGHDGAWLTERYVRAIRHPLVNVITHPANRSPGHSTGYDIDFDALFAAAAATGTAMEIDGAPGHLDMDGRIARRAVAAGVTITIDSDCHRADALARQMRFGLGTARRGWIEPKHVLNTRSVDDVRAFVARKRAGR
jgi:DNA polymerase (family X)